MTTRTTASKLALLALALAATTLAACGNDASAFTVYSGRQEELVAPIIERFEAETGIDVQVRYGSSTDLAATIREEGSSSPADVFFAQDPGALGVVAQAGLFAELPVEITSRVDPRFSDSDARWVGTSGRSRVAVYDTRALSPSDLPDSVDGFTDPAWRGRLAIAPSNGSFIAFVAAMILERGEDATREWLQAIADNDPVIFSGNVPIVTAVDDGSVAVGLANHYYLLRLIEEQGAVNAANHFFPTPGPGSLVMPAGAGVLATSDNAETAVRFIAFLLSDESQRFFADETFEYPVAIGVAPNPVLPPLDSLTQADIDLSDLATTLDRATDLIAEVGLL